MKNLYIIQQVLYDYTDGMVCIAADNLTQCRELFIQEFVQDKYDHKFLKEFDDAIKNQEYKVMQVVHSQSEVVSYVYGGS